MNQTMRRLAVAAAAVVLTALSACSSGSGSDSAAAPSDSTVRVAITPALMPYVGTDEAGALTGLDGELFTKAATDLGLTVEVNTVQFPALLAGVQSDRFDVGIGNVAWKADRAQAGIFTDPPYYTPIVLAVREGLTLPDIASLENRALGSISGDIFQQALRAIPGTEVRAFPDINSAIADVEAGRIDAAVLDSLTVGYLKQQRPEMAFMVQTLAPATDAQVQAQPELAGLRPFMTGWYLGEDKPALADQFTEKIRGYYADGTLDTLVTKWGAEPASALVPSPQFAAERAAVDRPADWTPPTTGKP